MSQSIHLRELGSDTLLPVKVLPGSRQSGVRGIHDGALKVSVTAVAEKGKANKAVLQLLAKCLQLSRTQVTIHSGTADTRKWILIVGVDEDELRRRLGLWLSSSESS